MKNFYISPLSRIEIAPTSVLMDNFLGFAKGSGSSGNSNDGVRTISGVKGV